MDQNLRNPSCLILSHSHIVQNSRATNHTLTAEVLVPNASGSSSMFDLGATRISRAKRGQHARRNKKLQSQEWQVHAHSNCSSPLKNDPKFQLNFDTKLVTGPGEKKKLGRSVPSLRLAWIALAGLQQSLLTVSCVKPGLAIIKCDQRTSAETGLFSCSSFHL